MSAKKAILPVTHSDVLWHFTGGPKWNSRKKMQSKKTKSNNDSFEILIKILKSKTLRLGSYHELLKVSRYNNKRFDSRKKKLVIEPTAPYILHTSPVCCLADIPLAGLKYHSLRYGKCAIGFKRSSILKAKFNPVFYTLHTEAIANSYLAAHNSLNSFNMLGIEGAIDSVRIKIQDDYQFKLESIRDNLNTDSEFDNCPRCGEGLLLDIDAPVDNVEDEIEYDDTDILQEFNEVDKLFAKGLSELRHLMSYVKTFEDSEFNTIYAEREWRSLKAFSFRWSDVDSIVLPLKGGYFDKFESKYRNKFGIPKRVKIMTWEGL